MITLGTIDQDVQPPQIEGFFNTLKTMTVETWGKKLRGDGDGEWIELKPLEAGPLKVREVQQFLKQAGFFPAGQVDGICGYRTSAAIRLFQEYIRTVEKISDIGFPDGKFGNKSAEQVRRWQAANQQADWAAFSAANPSPGYTQWLTLLQQYKQQALSAPSAILQKVNAFAGASDTVKPANWDFDPNKLHLIGIRRMQAGGQAPAEQRFDDVFVLLTRGLVFKFFGTTDPGATSSPAGYPFLVPGQHLFRFGWHKLSDANRVYHALKPLSTSSKTPTGVLVVRSADKLLTEQDFTRKLEANTSINIHWGGEGGPAVKSWSEGCQVLVGRAYINHHDEALSCTAFAANGYTELGKKNALGVYQTKGAYSVLEDLVAAFSDADNAVRYTLLHEQDLALNPALVTGQALEILNRLKAAKSAVSFRSGELAS
jgi:peptidoglycan hydrolase-like protein with peptidoglycan-binding domain